MHYLVMILCCGLLFAVYKYVALKKQIRCMNKQIPGKQGYHAVSIELRNRDLEALALKFNRLLEENQALSYQARQANQELKNNIADISHDMRTPLTSVIGYLQLLLQDGLTEQQRNYSVIALKKAKDLRSLLTEFFELSYYEAEIQPTEPETLDLSALLCEAILEHSRDFHERNIQPVFRQADTVILISCRKDILKRILENLITNCIRYAEKETVFMIHTRRQVILSVSNPVSNQKQMDTAHLFDKYYKAKPSRSGESFGLGLAIVKLLAEKSGGGVSADFADNRLTINVSFAGVEQKFSEYPMQEKR